MSIKLKVNKTEGSITVFLSLVLLLILSLVMTIIEGARVNTAKVFAERSLTTAMDSVTAEFYGPLMEEYHLLALDSGYGTNALQEEEIKNRLEDFMSYTFDPDKGFQEDRWELYDISTENITMMNYTGLMEYQGELFINEAVEYEKYRELGNGLEHLLNKMSLLEKPKKVSYIYEEKSKVEEELVAIDEGILALMKHLDGISTNKKGLKTAKDGTLKTEPYFVKKICYGEPSQEKVGINQTNIYNVLKTQYIDPSKVFASIDHNLNLIEESIQKIKKLQEDIKAVNVQLQAAYEALSELSSLLVGLKDKASIVALGSQLESCEREISGLESKYAKIQKDLEYYENVKRTAYEEIFSAVAQFRELSMGLMFHITEAQHEINSILKASEKADPLIGHYEEILSQEKDELGSELYDGLEEGIKEIKRYQTGNQEGYDFHRMKVILEHDNMVLGALDYNISRGEQALSAQDFQSARESFREADRLLQTYQTEGLKLDYSTLVIRKETDLDPLSAMETLIGDGLTGLVIDTEKISKSELKSEMLPSALAALSGEGESGFDFTSFFGDVAIGGKNTGMGNLFGSFGDYNTTSLLGEGVNRATEHLLFQSYLQEHFYQYPTEGETEGARKPSTLSYEQEYLLLGKSSDKENLVSVISKIIFLRTILDFTVLLGDKAKWAEAKSLAAALVGFTGLPILVSITQTLLMILLAFAEALVDTCALLIGKEIPVLKNKITLAFYDLLKLNRSFIQSRASSYPTEQKLLSFGYSDYIKLFLFFKNKEEVSYRAMDLIQENIRLRYEDTFRISNCLYGFETEAKFNIEPKFSMFSYVHDYFQDSSIFKHSVKSEYSY